VISERELTPDVLARSLTDCLGNFDGLVASAEAAHARAKHAVAERIAEACVAAAEARR
jgi:UDP-N-acetylglucosamine:LPS N-acetylglucosamine transferase